MKNAISENRLWHLRQLIRSVGGTNEAARRIGKMNSYITQIAGPSPYRQIGDKMAAQIEAGFGLPPGALDVPPPPEHLRREDDLLGQITATLSNATDADKEFVLAMSQWLVKKSLTGNKPSIIKIKAESL